MIIELEWRQMLKSLVIWTVIFTLVIWGFSAIYPQMHTSAFSELVNGKVDSLSPALLKTFNIEGSGIASFTTAIGFFAYYFQYLFLAACCFVLLNSTQELIKEESDGTIEFLYALPITRSEIFVKKVGLVLVNSALFWLIAFLNALGATVWFKATSDHTNQIIQKLSLIFGQELVVLWLLISIGFFLSSWLKSNRQSIGISLGIVFGIYLIGILSALTDTFAWLENWSFIHRTLPSKLITDSLSIYYSIGLVGLGALFLLGGYARYTKKDLVNK